MGDSDNTHYDIVIVGSGINSLVCAALLAKRGRRVCIIERNKRLGGCIRTEETTVPGFKHEIFSAVHPLVVSSLAYAELKADLHNLGLEYCNNSYPTAVVMPDNRSLILTTSRKDNIQAMENLAAGDGETYRTYMSALEQNANLVFGLLSNRLWSLHNMRLLLSELWQRGFHGLVSFAGESMQSCRRWLDQNFQSEVTKAMLAPWVLHAGLGPEAAFSGLMNQVMAFTLEQTGNPVVKGGNEKIVDIYAELITSRGGELYTNTDVTRVIAQRGVACGVETADGKILTASRAVVCNVTPSQLYQRLLSPEDIPESIYQESLAYQYGRGMMIIHLALNEPPQWANQEINKVVMLHVTSGLDGVSKAVNEADRGLLPEEATIVVCQPTAVDPSRAPEGKWILWIQLQEIPRIIKGDAKKEIAIPEDGRWNDNIKEQYADRIISQLGGVIPNLEASILGRKVFSPKDIESLNINLVGGDAYSGICSLDQFFFWRPLRSLKNHTTPLKRLFHIGASTHPGPGLSGQSGYLVAKSLG